MDEKIMNYRRKNSHIKASTLLNHLKKACLKWHPDKSSGDKLNFMIISAGMEIVRNPDSLKKYNRMVCCKCDKIYGDFEVFDIKKIESSLDDMFCTKCEKIICKEKNETHSCFESCGFWCLNCMNNRKSYVSNNNKGSKNVKDKKFSQSYSSSSLKKNNESDDDYGWYSNPNNDWYDDDNYLSQYNDEEQSYDFEDPYSGYEAYEDYDYD